MTDCLDCDLYALSQLGGNVSVWPLFTANCQGCMDRALAGLKTLPPLEPPPKTTEDSQ